MVNGMDARKIIQTVQAGLLLVEAQQNNTPEGLPLLAEMESTAGSTMSALNDMIDVLLRYQRLWLANGVDALLDATEAETVPNGGVAFKKERWLELRAVFLSLTTWLNAPVRLPDDAEDAPASGPLPIMVIAKRA